MIEYRIKRQTLVDIANAIRQKIGNGGGQITPLEMPDAIESIVGYESLPTAEGTTFNLVAGRGGSDTP